MTVHHRLQEARPGLPHPLQGDPPHRPGGGFRCKVPPNCVGAVPIRHGEGIDRVPPGLAHLLAPLVQAQARNQDPLVGGLAVEEDPGHDEGVEPPPGLVEPFTDEVRRIILPEELPVLEGIVPLGGVHGPGVEPGVQHMGHPLHLPPAVAPELHPVDVGAVELHPPGELRIHGPLGELGPGADDHHPPTCRTLPHGEGRPPEAIPGEGPVPHGVQEVPETPPPHVLGVPLHRFVFGDDLLLLGGGGDEPRIQGVVEEGRVAAPAEGVLVLDCPGAEEPPPLP